MKLFYNNITTGIISFIISFLLFFTIMIYPFFTQKAEEKAALKNQPSVAYTPPRSEKTTNVKINIENCPTDFLVKISPKSEKITVSCKSVSKEKYSKQISFNTEGFKNVVNYLNGVEIETPYGLPSPANTDIIIAANERLFVYGASLAALLCNEASPTAERLTYCCYALGEVCLKFIKEGDTELYKFLNQNCETDISYTEYYDNYKALKETIKYADVD